MTPPQEAITPTTSSPTLLARTSPEFETDKAPEPRVTNRTATLLGISPVALNVTDALAPLPSSILAGTPPTETAVRVVAGKVYQSSVGVRANASNSRISMAVEADNLRNRALLTPLTVKIWTFADVFRRSADTDCQDCPSVDHSSV